MSAVLVDSNVLLDVFTQDQDWFEWSSAALARCADQGPLVISPVVYAEISVRFSRIEELDAALGGEFERRALPWPAAYLAGRSFLANRRRGGRRTSTLPDFYVGAHAAVEGLSLLTRDPGRYHTYFPGLELIAP